MPIWKKTVIGTTMALASALVVGYVTAWLSLAPCTDETFQEIQHQGISGTDMLGNKVALGRNDVSARIVGPFLVETQYMVPYDLHGSLHLKQYVVLPWGRHERSSDVIQLVAAPTPSRWLGANKLFNSTAGVGPYSSNRSRPAAS